jgi:hypothetical protein
VSHPEEYDVVVLGSGRARSLAWSLASQRKRVAVVERRNLAGSCPTKRLLEQLGRLGTKCKKTLAEHRTLIQAKDSKSFEQGLEMLGRLLGAEAKRFTEDGAPDGFWRFGDWHAFVFESKTDESKQGSISLNTVRQAATHEQAVRSKKLLPDYVPCSTVIISPRTTISKLALPSAGNMLYVSHADIIALFDGASKTFEEVRAASVGNTDEVLRERFLQHYKN